MRGLICKFWSDEKDGLLMAIGYSLFMLVLIYGLPAFLHLMFPELG